MAEDELDELRKRRMEQMVQAQGDAGRDEEAKRELETQKQAVMRQILTPEARERLTRLKMAKPEFAEQVEIQLISLAQSGRLKSILGDEQLKAILTQLTPKKREIKIKRI